MYNYNWHGMAFNQWMIMTLLIKLTSFFLVDLVTRTWNKKNRNKNQKLMVAITTMKGTNKSRFTITSNQAFFTTDVFNPIASRLGVQLTSKQIQHMFRLLRCIHHRGVTGSRLATLIQCPYRIVHNHFVLLTTGKKPRLIFFFLYREATTQW